MSTTRKSLAKYVTMWIITSVATIALITFVANLYISEQHAKNSEQMSEQLQQLVDIQTLNNSLNRLVTSYRGYLAFERQEFYDLSLKEKYTFDQTLKEYSEKQLLLGKY